MVAADWVTISSLATAGGTLVLALATFASVRSANRAARVAERSLLLGLRPLLLPSKLDDPPQKVGFIDEKWFLVPPGGAVAEVGADAIYLAINVRNAGSGIAVLHGWTLYPDPQINQPHRDPDEFTRLTRDLYVPAGDVGFWQGALRDRAAPEFAAARDAIEARRWLVLDVLYGDHEGGQRVITRFSMQPRDDGGWIAGVGRHWNVDAADPR
jgi:hypothetical protein